MRLRRCSFGVLFFAASLHAQIVTRADDGKTFILQEEDDSLVSTSLASDRGYTNGTRLLWRWQPASETRLGRIADALCGHHPVLCESHVTAGLGQNMYTPENLRVRVPIRGDRPYGGWLYGTLMLDTERESTVDHLELYAGVIGRDSHADDAQIFVHKHVTPAAPDPLGWPNQIGEWAAGLVRYDRRLRLLPRRVDEGRPVWFDLTPALGGSLGNVFIDGHATLTARLGYRLPAQFIEPIVSTPLSLQVPGLLDGRGLGPAAAATPEARRSAQSSRPPWDAYVYVSGTMSYVGRNVFIDAEDERYRIERRNTLREHRAGVAVRFHGFRFAYQYTHVSPEFRPLIPRIAQPQRAHSYGMVMISVGPDA